MKNLAPILRPLFALAIFGGAAHAWTYEKHTYVKIVIPDNIFNGVPPTHVLAGVLRELPTFPAGATEKIISDIETVPLEKRNGHYFAKLHLVSRRSARGLGYDQAIVAQVWAVMPGAPVPPTSQFVALPQLQNFEVNSDSASPTRDQVQREFDSWQDAEAPGYVTWRRGP